MNVTESSASCDLHIEATASEVRRASDWLALQGALRGVPQEQIGRLDLCLNEALANVIDHAYAHGAHKPIDLVLEVGNAQAAVTVTDEGPAFDTTSAPTPDRPRSLAEAEPGGLGLLMIRSFSDAVGYRRINGRNELRFQVNWA